jgi:hypothetical protein
MIPKRGLKFPSSHKVLPGKGGAERELEIAKEIRRSQAAPFGITAGQAALLFLGLFERCAELLPRRATEGRNLYWQDVADNWEKKENVGLDSKDVRDLALAILRAERNHGRDEPVLITPFLQHVRYVNDFLRVNEADSDEAAEVWEEEWYWTAHTMTNVFQKAPYEKIPWQTVLQTTPNTPHTPQPQGPAPQNKKSKTKKNNEKRRAKREAKAQQKRLAAVEEDEENEEDEEDDDFVADIIKIFH